MKRERSQKSHDRTHLLVCSGVCVQRYITISLTRETTFTCLWREEKHNNTKCEVVNVYFSNFFHDLFDYYLTKTNTLTAEMFSIFQSQQWFWYHEPNSHWNSLILTQNGKTELKSRSSLNIYLNKNTHTNTHTTTHTPTPTLLSNEPFCNHWWFTRPKFTHTRLPFSPDSVKPVWDANTSQFFCASEL